MPTHESLLNEEFASMVSVFERYFPQMAKNPSEIVGQISKLDQAIILVSQVWVDQPLQRRERELGAATLLRNFLARYIGQTEIETPALVLPPPAVAEDDSAQPAQDAGVQVDSQAAA